MGHLKKISMAVIGAAVVSLAVMVIRYAYEYLNPRYKTIHDNSLMYRMNTKKEK